MRGVSNHCVSYRGSGGDWPRLRSGKSPLKPARRCPAAVSHLSSSSFLESSKNLVSSRSRKTRGGVSPPVDIFRVSSAFSPDARSRNDDLFPRATFHVNCRLIPICKYSTTDRGVVRRVVTTMVHADIVV